MILLFGVNPSSSQPLKVLVLFLSILTAVAFPREPRNRDLRAATTKMPYSDEEAPHLLLSLKDKLGMSNSALARLFLASQSPRRKEILDMMGLQGLYSVETSPLDETSLQKELTAQNLSPEDYTRRLAEAKALALAESHLGNKYNADKVATFYLGSDTIVELDGLILEKPKDPADAHDMLSRLSGRQHHVHTAVAVYRLFQGHISLVSSFTDTASVTFCKLCSDTIDHYVSSGEPLDKAGKSFNNCF